MLEIALKKVNKVYVILDRLDKYPIKEKKLITSWFRSIINIVSKDKLAAMRCLFVS